MAPRTRNAKPKTATRHMTRLQKNDLRQQIAQIGLAIAERFPGLIATGVGQGKTIADLACGLIEKLARLNGESTQDEVHEAMRQTG